MASPVQDREPITRFIYSSRHLSRENNRVKAEAFLPNQEGKTSVFRIEELAECDIWIVGRKIERTRSQTLHGRGDIIASEVRKKQLEVTPDEPPARHANIIGWPPEKSGRKLMAQQLAASSALALPE